MKLDLQASIEHLPGLFYIIDREGTLLNCNQGLAILLNFNTPNEFIGLNLYELLSKKYSEAFMDNLLKQNEKILFSQQPSVIKESWHKLGHQENYLAYKTPLQNQLQNLSIPMNNYNDYGLNLSSELNRQAKSTLFTPNFTHNFDHLFNIIALMPGNVYWKDKQGRFLGCNNNFAKIIKLDDPQKVIGLRDIDILTPEAADKVLKLDQWIIENNQAAIAIEEGFDLNGKKTTYLSHKVPLQDKNGYSIGIIGISLNINEYQNNIQEQLNQKLDDKFTGSYSYNSVDYLFNIISLMPGNVYWKDLEGRYLGCNNHFAKIVKLSDPREIIGVRDIDLFSSVIANEVLKTDEAIITNNKPLSIEEIGFDDGGNKIVYLSHKVPLQNKQGHAIGLLGISLDITERKKMEEKLKETTELAKQANQSKSQFLVNMSHDIRTPLNGIMGMAQILKGLETDNHKLEIINALIISSRTLGKLCGEIIEYTDIYKHGVPIKKTIFSAVEILTSLEQILNAQMKKKKLALHIQLDSQIPTQLLGDEMRLHRILLNLLGNAVKFTDKGVITVKLALKEANYDQVTVQIEIRDTGIGIPADKFDYIFEHFSRLTLSDRSKYKGSGLGLTIVKQFVSDLNGSINVASKLNEGTTFTVTLPFQRVTMK